MKIHFLEVQKNLFDKQQTQLAAKIATIEELTAKITAKEEELGKAQVKYYATLEEADEKVYIAKKDELDGLKKELEEAEKGKILIENFILAYPEGQLIREVEDYIEATGFNKKVDNYVTAYNKLLEDAKALNSQYTDLQVAANSLKKDIYEIAKDIKYIKNAELEKINIKDRFEIQQERINYRVRSVELKEIKGA